MTFVDDLREQCPALAQVFEQMAVDETEPRHRLLGLYEKRFGPNHRPSAARTRPLSATSQFAGYGP
jgi:erythrin-vacuolar iron transport family protein